MVVATFRRAPRMFRGPPADEDVQTVRWDREETEEDEYTFNLIINPEELEVREIHGRAREGLCCHSVRMPSREIPDKRQVL
jgi:hypothetical protein